MSEVGSQNVLNNTVVVGGLTADLRLLASGR